MATTTGTFVWYNKGKKNLGDTIDIGSDAFAVLLTTSTYTPAQTHEFVSDITNEVTGNGYSRKVLSSVTWTEADGTVTFDSDDPVWTASGGSIVARYWILFDNTPATDAGKQLLAYGLLDDTPADVTTTDGNTLTYNVPASGWFTLA